MCVSEKHRLVIVSNHLGTGLLLYSLDNGSFIRSIGRRGRGKGQFMAYSGGLCVSPDGDSVLLAEERNDRVQEVRITGPEEFSWVRFVGEGILTSPDNVDCDNETIAVLDIDFTISIFSWRTGVLVSRFDVTGNVLDRVSGGIRLINDGFRLAVFGFNQRLCMYSLDGEFVGSLASRNKELWTAGDVLESETGGFLVAANSGFFRLSSSGDCELVHAPVVGPYERPYVLAATTDGGLVVRYIQHIQMYRGLRLRTQWVALCASSGAAVNLC